MMISMGRKPVYRVSVGIFLLSLIWLTVVYHSTFIFDRPVHSAVYACLVAGITFLLLGILFPHLLVTPTDNRHYSAIPLTDLDHSVLPSLSPIFKDKTLPSFASWRVSGAWIIVAFVSALLSVRIELLRRLILHTECSKPGYAYSIPFLLSLYDYVRIRRQTSPERDDSYAHPLLRYVRLIFLQSTFRYVIASFFLMLAGFWTVSFNDAHTSTYICPIILNERYQLRILAVLSVIIDTLLLIILSEISRADQTSWGRRGLSLPLQWGFSFLGVPVIWGIITVLLCLLQPENREFFFKINWRYAESAFVNAGIFSLLCASALNLMPRYGILGLAVSATSLVNYLCFIAALWAGTSIFPYLSIPWAILTLLVLCAGLSLYLVARAASDEDIMMAPWTTSQVLKAIFALTGFALIMVAVQTNKMGIQPIDLLIYEGKFQHSQWLERARSSTNLQEAVENYKNRYHQYPPPGFDNWYAFAVSRSSVVIDDFDQIYEDLGPFRAMTPQDLRRMTVELATNPFNDIGAVRVRNGTARIQEGIKPTHAWMVEAAVKMMEPFVEYLPDMDLALNLNDEPRIAVPYNVRQGMKDHANSINMPPLETVLNGWSRHRDESWEAIEPADRTPHTIFRDYAYSNIFDTASVVCPSSSKARTTRVWDHSKICLDCFQPHALGQFVANWNYAADICHQPDLAHLHGFFISPSSFKVTHEPVPLFSQSSVRGFTDIMFPSPWNYIEKVSYNPSDEHPDPPFIEKENSIFWRGSTTEGMSINGGWRGMVRQRFTHLMNNNTGNAVSVLMRGGKEQKEIYHVMDGMAPSQVYGLNASVQLIDSITRCGDCDIQEEELQPGEKVEFHEHWKHRYLFDMDGAGFSGRFHTFLFSHSLPFKTALFRQWFDSRIMAWQHFVPQDLRLHDVWSTLAYFSGVTVKRNGQTIELKAAHEKEGEWIAEEGRKWAQQALRKEDMEIYFFRLLLEWGRLTDDLRDQLGLRL